jgi:hypothetical protein
MPTVFSTKVGIAYASFGSQLFFAPVINGLYLSRIQLQHQVRKSVRPTLGGGNVILVAGDMPGQASMSYFACPPCDQLTNPMASLYGYYLTNRLSRSFLATFGLSGINTVASLDGITLDYSDPVFNVQNGTLIFSLYL